MQFEEAFIPYGGYWSTPFCKWQGSFAELNPIPFAAEVAVQALNERSIPIYAIDELHLGMTVPAPNSFYGAPWLAGLIGADGITGPTISQACATSARLISGAASAVVASADSTVILCVAADRTSNGPHMVYPTQLSPGGRPNVEDWVWDNFNCDPYAKNSMIETAENVARERNFDTEAQHEVVLLRYEQYQQALKSEFHKRFMIAPIQVNPTGKKVIGEVMSDEGVFPTTAEGLRKLKPVMPSGTVTFGGQTYPADGNAGMLVTGRERAGELSQDDRIEIRLLSFAQGRAKPGYMPMANLPAATRALELAGLEVKDLAAIKTHNPFALNDLFLSDELDIPIDKMNNFGCSLIWGHPQGPTGMRLVIELIEELVLDGGGYGLFTGCAAGDTAAALVIEVKQSD
jgi:acetyl-CoA acetyltransferase